MRTRAEHMEWCKARAYEYIDRGDLKNALQSFASDLGKHEDTRILQEAVTFIGLGLLMRGDLSTPEAMRKHISGYN